MTEEYTVDSRNHNESHRNHKRELMSWVITIIGALVISLFIKAFIFNATTVDGNSMYPNLHDGDKLISNRIVLFYRSPKREEIVVFQSPINENEDYIKRVIGLPNDTIDLLEGKLYVNGKPIKESYLPEDTVTLNNIGNHWELEDDEFFVVGDNRTPGGSNDSRSFGPIDRSSLKGITSIRYYPFDDRIGSLK